MSGRTKRIQGAALLAAGVLGLAGCAGAAADANRLAPEDLLLPEASYAAGYTEVAAYGGMKLLADKSTGSVAVEADGHVWYANPEHPEEDPIASGVVQDSMRSQFTLYYYNENNELKTMDSYTDSVKNGQYRIEPVERGIEMVFTLGSFERGAADIPKVLPDARYRELFADNDALSASDKKWVEKRYRQEEDTWVWRETDANLIIEKMLGILDAVGYDSEQLEQDNAAAGVETEADNRAAFQVTVRYTLEDDGLCVEIPMEGFRYAGEVEPVRLDLLEFFAAAEDTPDGYLFVPDGSGALMRLERAESSDTYAARVYGSEDAPAVGEQPVRLPVYGLKNGDAAFLAMIEEGDALATIRAYNSGLRCSLSGVYSSFTLKESGYVTLGGQEEETEVLSFQSRLYDGNIRVLYQFLTGDKADYAGMAAACRERLIARGVLGERLEAEEFPLRVETIGAVKKAQSFLMIRYEGWEPLTTFAGVGEILDVLQGQQVDAVRVQMNAWASGGFDQAMAGSLSPLSVLGGKSGLKTLLETYTRPGVQMEGLVSFGRYTTGNPYTLYHYAAKTIDQAVAMDYPLDLVTRKPDKEQAGAAILSAARLPQVAEKFLQSSGRLQGLPAAVADLGDRLYGDYTRSDPVDREMAKRLTQQALEALAGGERLSVAGGNAYVLAYARVLSDIPLCSSGYMMLDEDIPFYAMVLHGYMEMSGAAVNYADDPQTAVLQAIESGTGVSCRLMAADSSLLKDTAYARYYSAGLDDAVQTVCEAYRRVNSMVGDLQGQTISAHRNDAGVAVTAYENGVRIYVNYTNADRSVDGVLVPARDAVRVG